MTAEGGRRAGPSWMARCSAHNDLEPSLSIRQAEDGTVLVRCHAGCEQARVITALGSLAANGLHDIEIRLNNQNHRFGRAV
jgi:hypothetical protein